MATYFPPKKNTAFIIYVALESVATAGAFQANPTLASGDFKVSIDGGTLNNLTTLPTVTPASGKMVKISLSSSEMNGDNITVVCSDASGGEWKDLVFNMQTVANQIDDIATALNTVDDFLDTEIAAIKAKTDNLPADTATVLDTIDNFLDTEVAAIKAKTDNLPADPADASDIAAAISGLNNLSAAQVATELATYDAPTKTEFDAAVALLATQASVNTIDDFLDTEIASIIAAIAALNNLSIADVNAQVLDVLVTDTFAEPTSPPAATASLKDKIGWLAALARNKITQTASTTTLRNDADSASIATSTVSDNGTTFTKGEWT